MTTMMLIHKTAFDVFEEAISDGIQPTIRDSWADFACWEMARRFADDPSHPARAAIEWIRAMENLRGWLDEFEGASKMACIAALDEAYEAFAKLNHSAELVHAVEKWLETRREQ
jgi:hypothetical protein